VLIYFREVIAVEDKSELVKKLQEMFPQRKISCTEARRVAVELDIELAEMGELCDKAGLKIYGCELGCF